MNARNKGHNYERRIAKELRDFFPAVLTSRYASRETDDRGIDLVNTGDFAIQCKAYTAFNLGQLKETFKKLLCKPTEIKTIFLNYTRKGQKGEYVIMPKEDFYKLLIYNQINKNYE